MNIPSNKRFKFIILQSGARKSEPIMLLWATNMLNYCFFKRNIEQNEADPFKNFLDFTYFFGSEKLN